MTGTKIKENFDIIDGAASFQTVPLKKATQAEKERNDYLLCREWMSYLHKSNYRNNSHNYGITYSDVLDTSNSIFSSREENEYMYRIANGEIPTAWYAKVSNLFNLDNEKLKEIGKKIDNFNLIYTNFISLLGDKKQRPFNFSVANVSPEAANKMLEEKLKTKRAELHAGFEQLINLPEQEMQQKAQELQQEFEKKMNEKNLSYKDTMAYNAQMLMTEVLKSENYDDKKIEMFRHWLTVGEAIMRVYIKDDSLKLTPVSPEQVHYIFSTNDYDSKYIHNAEGVFVRYNWTLSKILEEFSDLLGDSKELDILDEQRVDNVTSYNRVRNYFPHIFEGKGSSNNLYNLKMSVCHYQWYMYKKVGVLSYDDPDTLERQKIDIDETFKIPKLLKTMLNVEVEWHWEKELWEGWSIADRYTLGIRAVPYQNSYDYVGKIFSALHSKPTSFVKLGLPYLKMFIYCWYKLEEALASSFGEVTMMPMEMFVGEEGRFENSIVTAIRTMKKMKIFPYSVSNPQVKSALSGGNMIHKANLSSANEAQFYLNLLQTIAVSWDNFIGITPGQRGNPSPTQAVGNLQMELSRGTVVTEYIFSGFEDLEEQILQKVIDMTQYVYKEGKKQLTVRNDSMVEILDLLPVDYFHADFAVHVENSTEELKRKEYLRAIAETRASQGASSTELIEVILANSTVELRKVLYEIENKEAERVAQQSQNEERMKQETLKLQQEFEQMKAEIEIDKEIRIAKGTAEAEFPYEQELALLKLQANQLSFQNTDDSDGNGIPDVNEAAKLSNDRMAGVLDLVNKEKDRKLKREELKSKEKIEKIKLKNPVAGEKIKK